MKKLLTIFLAGTTVFASAQKSAKPDAYAKTIAVPDLKKHLYILADPGMEGRETGTEGQRKAAAYIESYFKDLGLQAANNGSYQQLYSIYQDTLLSAAFEVNGKAYEFDKDFTVGNSSLQATMKLSEVVLIGAGATDSLKNADLAGRLVMVVGTANPGFYQQLIRKSPAAYLVVASNFPKTTPTSRKGRQSIRAFSRTVMPM